MENIYSENEKLLSFDDPDPVTVVHEESTTPFFLVCDHAGYAIPKKLNGLNLSSKDQHRHIAWDIGIGGVGRILADQLKSTLVLQNYSRLVIDCNRDVNHPTSVASVSDETVISGNQQLTEARKAQRINEIYLPYHDRIEKLLTKRSQQEKESFFISLHSFTPEMQGKKRPWHAGVLHDHHDRFSLIFKKLLESSYFFPVGDNEPYALTEENDYSVPYHALKRKIPYLELEIRQDLITTEFHQKKWAKRLAVLLLLTLKEYRCNDDHYWKG